MSDVVRMVLDTRPSEVPPTSIVERFVFWPGLYPLSDRAAARSPCKRVAFGA